MRNHDLEVPINYLFLLVYYIQGQSDRWPRLNRMNGYNMEHKGILCTKIHGYFKRWLLKLRYPRKNKTKGKGCQPFFKLPTFSLEFQKFFSIKRTIFSHIRSEQFCKQIIILPKAQSYNKTDFEIQIQQKILGYMKM